MSEKHPIISVTGSSGAGTSTVGHTFAQIFRREGIRAAFVPGDGFHRLNRPEMEAEIARRAGLGDHTFSHFSLDANLLEELQALFRNYAERGRGRFRRYAHDAAEAHRLGVPEGHLSAWEEIPEGSDLLFYEGLHGAVRRPDLEPPLDIAGLADVKVGVVPVINLEWIQKIHRDRATRGQTTEAVTDTILRRMHDYVQVICPQFTETDINFQRVPVVDTSNPFIARWIPTPEESLVAIRFRNPRGADFPYLLSMIEGSWMSRANSIVIPGGRLDLAMQLILTPLIIRLIEAGRRAR